MHGHFAKFVSPASGRSGQNFTSHWKKRDFSGHSNSSSTTTGHEEALPALLSKRSEPRMESVELSQKQKYFVEKIAAKESVFITGAAGTGLLLLLIFSR
jgi:hypothetical protein